MEKFGRKVVKLRIPILIVSFLLLIPAVLGYVNTRVNYDILYYLPQEYSSKFYNEDSDATMLAIFFDDTTSSDGTMEAIKEIRRITE